MARGKPYSVRNISVEESIRIYGRYYELGKSDAQTGKGRYMSRGYMDKGAPYGNKGMLQAYDAGFDSVSTTLQ